MTFKHLLKILGNPCDFICSVVDMNEEEMPKEFQDLIDGFKLDKEFVRNELLTICKIMIKKYRRFAYPLEIIPIPCYKFTKRPLIKWEEVQDLDPNDRKAIELRYVCSILGNYINVLIPLRHMVHIDLDFESVEQKERIKNKFEDQFQEFFDVETRRGFHKFFYIPDYYAVGFAWKIYVKKPDDTVEEKLSQWKFWQTIHLPSVGAKLDIRSSPKFLAIYPEQSHYLIYDGKELRAFKYRCISGDCAKFVLVADISSIKASVEEVKDFILKVIKRLEPNLYEKVRKDLVLKGFTKEEFEDVYKQIQHTKPKKFDSLEEVEYIPIIGNLSYKQFKQVLDAIKFKLPRCVQITFFEKIPKGFCYAFARLACTIIPFFVHVDRKELEEIVIDFYERAESFKTPKTYYWEYFMFGIPPEADKIGFPSPYGIGCEVFEIIKEHARCDECSWNYQCYYYNKCINRVEQGLKVREIIAQIIPKELIEYVLQE